MNRAFVLVAALLGAVGASHGQAQSRLSIAGQPYFGGPVTISVEGLAGQPVLLAYGLDPLPLWAPAHCSKGSFFIGSFVSLAALGVVGSNGQCEVSVVLPPESPGLAGTPIGLQAYAVGDLALSNPSTLPLDVPYCVPAGATILESPNPTNVGLFGDVSATGDLNDDGAVDIVAGAWFEDAGAINRSGRTYVFWGPDFTATLALEPPAPKPTGYFGLGVWIADVDEDGVADLLVGEGCGDPPVTGEKGKLHVYRGGPAFSATPAFDIQSLGEGVGYSLFGRALAVADFDGDGATDIAVGLPNVTDQGLVNAGRIDVYWGPTFTATLSLGSPDADAEDYFGTDLAAGDVNGDNVADLIEGNGRESVEGIFGIGRVYLFTGPSLLPWKTLENPLPAGQNSRFGNAVAARDLNGDGKDEVITTDQRDHVYIFWSSTFDEWLVIQRPPDPGSSGSGYSVSFGYFLAVGDLNGDGLSDIAVTEPFYGASAGRVLVAVAPFYSCFHIVQDKVPIAGKEFGWGVHVANVDLDPLVELLVGSDLATAAGVLGAGHLTVFELGP